MRIDATQLPETPKPEGSRSSGSREASGPHESASDAAHVSLGSASLTSLRAKLNGLPDVRQDRVKALRTALQNGSFKPDSQQIADAMYSEFFLPGAKRT